MSEPYPQSQEDSHNLIQARTAAGSAAEMRALIDRQAESIRQQAEELEALKIEFTELRRRYHILMVRTHNAQEYLQSRGTPQAAINGAWAELQDGREGR